MAISLPNTNNGGAPLVDSLTPDQLTKFGSAFDMNHDGKLDDDEEAGLEAFLKENDGNHDGKLDPTETSGAEGKLAGLTDEQKKNYIKNASSGSSHQYDTYYAYGQGHTPSMDSVDQFADDKDLGHPGAKEARKLKEELIKKFDKDGDGKLTGAERGAAEEYLKTKNGKGSFGHDDVHHALSDIGDVTPESVDGYFEKAKSAAGGGGSGSGTPGTFDPNTFDPSNFSIDKVLASLPPEYRAILEKYLPKK